MGGVFFSVYDLDTSSPLEDVRVSLSGVVKYTDIHNQEVTSDDGGVGYTDDLGGVHFDELEEGRRMFTAYKMGYFEYSGTINVGDPEDLYVDVYMEEGQIGGVSDPGEVSESMQPYFTPGYSVLYYPHSNIVDPWNAIDTARQKYNSNVIMTIINYNWYWYFIYDWFNVDHWGDKYTGAITPPAFGIDIDPPNPPNLDVTHSDHGAARNLPNFYRWIRDNLQKIWDFLGDMEAIYTTMIANISTMIGDLESDRVRRTDSPTFSPNTEEGSKVPYQWFIQDEQPDSNIAYKGDVWIDTSEEI